MCSHRENFCNMCCDFHIGLNFPVKRFSCKKKCGTVVAAKKKPTKKNLKTKKNDKKNLKTKKNDKKKQKLDNWEK